MNMENNERREENIRKLSDFYRSNTDKIYLLVGKDECALYDFYDESIEKNLETNNDLFIFHYEIRDKEHSKHFLYRWLYETVSGKAFRGFGQWSDITEKIPHLQKKLNLLMEQDIRPLEIRFLEAVRFIAADLDPKKRVILSVIPRTDLSEKIFVDFFRSMVAILPFNIKMVIWQVESDVVAQQADFSPSNRIMLEDTAGKDADAIQKRYEDVSKQTSENAGGNLIRTMSHLVYPADVDLLSCATGGDGGAIEKTVQSDDLSDLVETVAGNCFRLAYPRSFPHADSEEGDFEEIDKRVTGYFEKRLLGGSGTYEDVLCHSFAISRMSDYDFISDHILKTCDIKLDKGAADLCDQEFEDVLALIGDTNDRLKADLLVKLGEMRESKKRNVEALDAIGKAVSLFKKIDDKKNLQHALELKGQVEFMLRKIDDSRASFEESLSMARDMDDDCLAADVLSQIGYLCYFTKKLDEAEKVYGESLDLYGKLKDAGKEEGKKGEAEQWANLGHTNYAKGNFMGADECHRKALEIFESLDNKNAQANQWGYLGHVHFAKKDFDNAIEAYEKSAAIQEGCGNPYKAVQRYASVGHVLYAQRKSDLAIQAFQKALDKYREFGDAGGEAAQLSNLGLVKGDQGEYDKAIEYFGKSADLYKATGNPVEGILQVIRMGHIYVAQKKYEDAEKSYKEALDQYKYIQYPIGKADVELNLAQMYYEKGDWDNAAEFFGKAASTYSELGNKEREASCVASKAYAEAALEDPDSALNSLDHAIMLYGNINDSVGVANAKSKKGLIYYYEKRDFECAERLYMEALEGFREGKDKGGESSQLANLGTLYYETKQLDKAQKEYESALSILRNINNPIGLAGVLSSIGYVYEQKKNYVEARSKLREAYDIYETFEMEEEMKIIEDRITSLEKKAGKSLEDIRSELFPGLGEKKSASGKKRSKKSGKIGRNDPCPCGSGKKYKACCGAN